MSPPCPPRSQALGPLTTARPSSPGGADQWWLDTPTPHPTLGKGGLHSTLRPSWHLSRRRRWAAGAGRVNATPPTGVVRPSHYLSHIFFFFFLVLRSPPPPFSCSGTSSRRAFSPGCCCGEARRFLPQPRRGGAMSPCSLPPGSLLRCAFRCHALNFAAFAPRPSPRPRATFPVVVFPSPFVVSPVRDRIVASPKAGVAPPPPFFGGNGPSRCQFPSLLFTVFQPWPVGARPPPVVPPDAGRGVSGLAPPSFRPLPRRSCLPLPRMIGRCL